MMRYINPHTLPTTSRHICIAANWNQSAPPLHWDDRPCSRLMHPVAAHIRDQKTASKCTKNYFGDIKNFFWEGAQPRLLPSTPPPRPPYWNPKYATDDVDAKKTKTNCFSHFSRNKKCGKWFVHNLSHFLLNAVCEQRNVSSFSVFRDILAESGKQIYDGLVKTIVITEGNACGKRLYIKLKKHK